MNDKNFDVFLLSVYVPLTNAANKNKCEGNEAGFYIEEYHPGMPNGIAKEAIEKLAIEILKTIAEVYWRPTSPFEVGEIILEHLERDQYRLDVAILNWSINQEENYPALDKVDSYTGETCHWGIVVDGILKPPKGFTSISTISFQRSTLSLGDVLRIGQTVADAYGANLRIYSLPLDFDERDASRHEFGEVGLKIVNIPAEGEGDGLL